MTKKVINIGATPNDRSGDSLRTSFDKINQNFTELYTALGLNADINLNLGAFEFNGSVMTTTDSTPITLDQQVNITSDLVMSGAIVPNITDIYDLGSPTKQWRSLYLTGNTVYFNGVPLSVSDDGTIIVNGEVAATPGGDLTWDSITGKPAIPTDTDDLTNGAGFITSTSSLVNGELEATLDNRGTINTPLLLPLTFTAVLDSAHKTGAPLTLTDTPWEFTVQFQVNPNGTVETMLNSIFPNLVNPGYTTADQFSFTEADHGIPGYTFELELDNLELAGPAGWTASPVVSIPPEYPSTVKSLGAVKLTANEESLTFGTDGSLTYQGANLDLTFKNQIGMDAALIWRGGLGAAINNLDDHLVIATNHNNTTITWQFGHDGKLQHPGDITQSYQDNTVCPPNVETVVYTATGQWQHAIKLFVIAEGLTDGGDLSWDTQACDIVAVKGYNNDIVHVTTYGVTYSGTEPIATFDGQWNELTNRIEITCSPKSTTTDVRVGVHAIEITSND